MKPDADPPIGWHALPLTEILDRVSAAEAGLTRSEARARLERFGANELPRRPPPTLTQLTLRQFLSPLIYILVAAAALALVLGDVTDAAFIGVVLLINALIGGYQEWRAEQGSQALERLLVSRAAVQRDGDIAEIDSCEVVPGDIVWLESGNRVPADLRLIQGHGLEVDESPLTGESLPVLKDAEWTGPADAPQGDRLNMAYAGTSVVRGRAKAVVVQTGASTAVGRLAGQVLEATGGKPPLLLRLERFTRAVGLAIIVAAVTVGGIGVLRGYSVIEMVYFSVALAVAAIPEGLPVAVTIALAVATHRMTRRGVIVRKLAAVEGLGSCSRIASDKTGTLTCNELTLRAIVLSGGHRFDVTGQGFEPVGGVFSSGDPVRKGDDARLDQLFRASVLCNEAELHHRDGGWVWRGDPTDVALLSAAHKAGWVREAMLDEYPPIHAIPFEPEYRFAATWHKAGDGFLVMVKGAPERVLEMCPRSAGADRVQALHHAHKLAEGGYRVLALAEGDVPRDGNPAEHTPAEPAGLTFLGLVGMIDPPRPGVHEAIRSCKRAGVEVSMVTGDHPVTALAISRDLGLASSPDEVMGGAELAKLNDQQLDEVTRRIRVFARVSPDQKLQIVNSIRRADQFVAVTGDGVNDAPALRAANIGVAMGRGGTDVARDASDIVIGDDNFATIVAGIEEGRIAYANIRNVIYLLISTGAAEVVMVALSVALGMPIPLLPVQLLWLNLVTNGVQHIGLSLEPGLGNELDAPPRPPQERIFNRLMIERTLIAAGYMGFVGVGVFQWLLHAGWEETSARNALLLLFVLFENFHLGNCRAEVQSSLYLSPLRSPYLLLGVIGAFLIHVAAMFIPPVQRVLSTAPVDFRTFVALVAIAASVFVVMEVQKWTWRVRCGASP